MKFFTIIEIFHGQGAVTTNGQECAQIGADILAGNGSAVDAAIAALLCEGIASLHRYYTIFFIFLYILFYCLHFICLSILRNFINSI